MNYPFITDEQRSLLLANGQESIETPDFDPPPVVKLFTPDAGATWLLTEIDSDNHDHAFGLCVLGLGIPELGWVGSAWPNWLWCVDAWVCQSSVICTFVRRSD